MRDVVRDLQQAGYPFQFEWFAPFLEFRFPRYGSIVCEGIEVELRQAIEPWNVLGEEVSAGGTARYVDSSVERLQVKVRHMTDSRHIVTCNGRPLPLHADRRARRIRRRRALSRLGAAFRAASDHRRAFAAGDRCRRYLERSLGWRLHLSRRPSGRPQLRELSRSTPTKPKVAASRASGVSAIRQATFRYGAKAAIRIIR